MADCDDFVLEGGRPWGVRLQGGKDSGGPLKIAQVTPDSKACRGGIVAGLQIVEINGHKVGCLTMAEAQNIIKGSGNRLRFRLRSEDQGTYLQASQPMSPRADVADQSFFDDLKDNMGGGEADWGSRGVKGNTFRMLQDHIDAGQTASVLSAFDKPCGQRNDSICTTAPKVQEEEDDTNSSGTREIVMEGGKPWGIRIQGGKDSGKPLHIANVTTGSKAYEQSMLVGDKIIAINDNDTSDLTMFDAQDLIMETGHILKLRIISTNQPGLRVQKADDQAFFDDLKNSVKGGTENWSGRQVKGSAFKMLQNIVDSGNVN